ncbi:MAG: alkaline phosphatase family protein [Nitrospirota bacterium]
MNDSRILKTQNSKLKTQNRVVVIGLDGATFDLIKPWAAEGKLPNLARLLKEGTHGELRSTIPSMTFPAWNSFMTGKNPGKHGVLDFTERKPNSYEVQFVNARMRRSQTIWRILSDRGYSVGVMAVPVTYPPESVNGFMISGFDAPGMTSPRGDNSMYPKELYAELKENVGEYVVTSNIRNDILGGRRDIAIRKILDTLERKGAHARYLLKKYAPDFFMVLFGETDLVGHNFWHLHDSNSPYYNKKEGEKYKDAILKVYQMADKNIGKLLELIDDNTTLIIMSDHGHGGCSDKAIYLNNWLAEKGFLKFANTSYHSGVNLFLDGLKNMGLRYIPAKIKGQIMRSKSIMFVNKIESRIRFSHIDWSGTRAYSEETPHFPAIWINLKGREPMGIVEPEEYDAIRDQIIDELSAFSDPETGQKIVKRIYRREEIYKGNYVENAPDLIIDWNLNNGYTYLNKMSRPSKDRLSLRKLESWEVHTARYGSHREFGIFIARGNGIPSGGQIKHPEIIDLAPTILYLLGLPIPHDIDGRVLDEIFKDGAKKPYTIYEDTDTSNRMKSDGNLYSPEEENLIRERLEGMGYL